MKEENYSQMTLLGGVTPTAVGAQPVSSGMGLKQFLSNESGGPTPPPVHIGPSLGDSKRQKKTSDQLLKGNVHFND